MKLAIVRTSSKPMHKGTYNSQEIGLAKALTGWGFSTDIFTVSPEGIYRENSVFSGNANTVKIYYLPFISLPGRQGVFPKIFPILKKSRYDLIMTSEDSQIMSVFLSLFGKKKNIPVVLWQGMYINYRGFIKRSLQMIYDLAFLGILRKSIKVAICKTKCAEGYLKSKGFQYIVVCNVGLDTEPFQEGNTVNFRKNHGISDTSLVLLYVGIVERRRNVDFIIRIFSRMLEDYEDAYLVIVGDGPLLDECKHLAEVFSLGDRVIFTGKVPQKELSPIYRDSNLFLLPSSYEIYGMVMMEALYFGIPVITTKNAGSREIIEDRIDGRILESLDVEEWIGVIRETISSPAKYELMRENSSKKIREKYTWDHLAEKYDSIFKCIVEKRE